MANHHYHAIIAGNSLAAQVAAVILAKGGCRVLLFSQAGSSRQSWFSSSLHLERLLENLGGRSCFTAPERFQVITSQSRLEMHGARNLAEELQREHPVEHPRVESLLGRLEALGQQLEETLWESGGLPLLGIKSKIRFRLQCLTGRLSWKGLKQPLQRLLAEYSLAEAETSLRTLFQGLSLAPFAELTVAEAALLWSSAIRADGVDQHQFEELLSRRFEQFHGRQEQLSTIEALTLEGSDSPSVSRKKGGSCSADAFIFGHPEALSLLPGPSAKTMAETPLIRQAAFTSNINALLPPLLAPRVILEGPQPLRLQIENNKGLVEYTEIGPSSAGQLNDLREQLRAALPFGDCQLSETGRPQKPTETGLTPNSFPGARTSAFLGKGMLLCHGGSILPTLGTTGELITGTSIAQHLLSRIRV